MALLIRRNNIIIDIANTALALIDINYEVYYQHSTAPADAPACPPDIICYTFTLRRRREMEEMGCCIRAATAIKYLLLLNI